MYSRKRKFYSSLSTGVPSLGTLNYRPLGMNNWREGGVQLLTRRCSIFLLESSGSSSVYRFRIVCCCSVCASLHGVWNVWKQCNLGLSGIQLCYLFRGSILEYRVLWFLNFQGRRDIIISSCENRGATRFKLSRNTWIFDLGKFIRELWRETLRSWTPLCSSVMHNR